MIIHAAALRGHPDSVSVAAASARTVAMRALARSRPMRSWARSTSREMGLRVAVRWGRRRVPAPGRGGLGEAPGAPQAQAGLLGLPVVPAWQPSRRRRPGAASMARPRSSRSAAPWLGACQHLRPPRYHRLAVGRRGRRGRPRAPRRHRRRGLRGVLGIPTSAASMTASARPAARRIRPHRLTERVTAEEQHPRPEHIGARGILDV
ncbi:MAG: hypothetical protein JWM19_2806 [Actinomycetia bacterium]|nr:hypothetical protein [Actinomycetes bacterium]